MGKPSHVLIIFEIVTAISLERNHMEVRNEGEPSYLLLVLESQKDSFGEKPFECKECGKLSFLLTGIQRHKTIHTIKFSEGKLPREPNHS
jgi:hypothetical protein